MELRGAYQFTYDPYSDNLVDDVSWLFPFYVVATDKAGKMSSPQKVEFEIDGQNDCP